MNDTFITNNNNSSLFDDLVNTIIDIDNIDSNRTIPILYNNNNNNNSVDDHLNVPYTICEVLVALVAVVGNAMVIHVFRKERRLRRRTNYYIVSLAVADFLVGLLGIPFAILASVGLPRNLHACLLTVSLLVVLCTISIFCLVAVSADRYWAILFPMGYSRAMRTKTAIGIISACWAAGTFIGFLPLLGWNAGWKKENRCLFVEVMDYNYLVFLFVFTIFLPSLLLALSYIHIYLVILKQVRQIVTVNPSGCSSFRTSGGTMLRVLGAAKKRDVKATQNLSIIVAFFVICWMPLYLINTVQAFCKECTVSEVVMKSCIILSHINSAGNPLLYAYHLRDFRAALKHFLYTSFGIHEEPVVNLYEQYFRPSLASSNYNYSYPRPLTNFRTQSFQSQTYLNSPNSRQKNQLRNQSSPYRNNIGRTLNRSQTSPILHNFMEASNTTNKREMWYIKEVSTEESSSKEKEISENSTSNKNQQKPQVRKDSGQLNNGYINESILRNTTNTSVPDSPPQSPPIKMPNSDEHQELSLILTLSPFSLKEKTNESHFTFKENQQSTSSPQLSKNLLLFDGEKLGSTSNLLTNDMNTQQCQRSHNNKIQIKSSGRHSASTNYLHMDDNSLYDTISSIKKPNNDMLKRHSFSTQNSCITRNNVLYWNSDNL